MRAHVDITLLIRTSIIMKLSTISIFALLSLASIIGAEASDLPKSRRAQSWKCWGMNESTCRSDEDCNSCDDTWCTPDSCPTRDCWGSKMTVCTGDSKCTWCGTWCTPYSCTALEE